MYIIFISHGINYVKRMLTHLKDVTVLTCLDNAQTSFRFLYKINNNPRKKKKQKPKNGKELWL